MTLLELQKVLGDRIEISLRDGLTSEERQQENEQSALIMGLVWSQLYSVLSAE